jgi:hypothetical protein
MNARHVSLRHTLATLAYRGGKVLRDAPEDFGDFRAGGATRTPLQILTHMGDLLSWLLSQGRGEERWSEDASDTWEGQVERFYMGLEALDSFLASDEPLQQPAEKLFQGGIADALTHVGQLAMLRRLAGSPVRGENYSRADIQAGRTGPDQTSPRREFD